MQRSVPHRLILEPLVRAALLEDLGLAGDITSNAVIPAGSQATVVLAGLDAARLAFELTEPALRLEAHIQDGTALRPGDVIATLSGPSRGLLAAERTALNFLGHLSGIATATAGLSKPSKARRPGSPVRARRRRVSGRSRNTRSAPAAA